MALSIWTLFLTPTSITHQMHTGLCKGLSNLSIKVRLRKAPPKEPLEALTEAADSEWRSAVELADKAGVSHKAAIRSLAALAESKGLGVKTERWVDERKRDRERKLYRKIGMTESERSALYNYLFAPRIPEGLKPTVVHRMKR